jgi:Uma2 family endonuclease
MALYTETMAAPVERAFDPLRDLDGMWSTALAERYLPLPGAPRMRYECWDGRLYMSPSEASPNSYGAHRLSILMDQPATQAGLVVYGRLNMTFAPQQWIEPDLCVLHTVPSDDEVTWVPATHFVMPVELISQSSRDRDLIDKPAKCEAAQVPFFMQVDINRKRRHVSVTLLALGVKLRYRVAAQALAGQTFEMSEPFPLAFDPAVLLEP